MLRYPYIIHLVTDPKDQLLCTQQRTTELHRGSDDSFPLLQNLFLRSILISDSRQLSGLYKHRLLASQERHCSKQPVAYSCILTIGHFLYKKLNSNIFSPKRLCVHKWCLAQKTDVISIRLI